MLRQHPISMSGHHTVCRVQPSGFRAGTWQGSGHPGRLRKGEAATSPALNLCWGSATGPPALTPRAAEISPAMRLRPSADLRGRSAQPAAGGRARHGRHPGSQPGWSGG